ncbi:MAG: tetratricopeptide repeat protein, partial [Candidatus Scalindua sp.]
LGVVLYEMLTGGLPFKGDYDQAVIYSILNEEPDSVRDLHEDVPENLLSLISKVLKKDSKSRISSIDIVLEELQQKQSYLSENTDEKSIAVLYFENMSPDKENEYFCAGITEDIIIDLSKIQELKVIPRTDVLPFQIKEVNSRKVGEILGVTHILEGSVRKAGQQIRVTAQLIDIQTGFQIWADRYDRLLEDIFELQVELSQKIAEALKVSLSESEKEFLTQKPTEDLRAYDFYMRGRDLLMAEGKKNNESAIKMFERAKSIDPNYSLAYVALAEAYSFQYIYYDGNQKWLREIMSANEKALQLDPELDEVEIAKGMVFYYQKRFAEAKQTFQNFLKRKDDNYQAHYWLGVLAEIKNDYDAAIKHFNRAAQIKPYSEEPWLHLEMTSRRKGDIKLAGYYGEKNAWTNRKKIERKCKRCYCIE